MVEEKAEQVGAAREFQSDEFYANDVSAPQFNPIWADSLSTAWILNGKGAYPGRCKIDTSPLFTHRRIYAYVWGKALADPAVSFCFLACEISVYLAQKRLMRIPLTFTLGTMPQQNVLAKSFFTAPLAGGTADANTLSVTLFNPNQNGIPEPTQPVLLQPFEINFKCDKITLDVLGWANIYMDQSRFILATVAP